jgi:hypothetical protein
VHSAYRSQEHHPLLLLLQPPHQQLLPLHLRRYYCWRLPNHPCGATLNRLLSPYGASQVQPLERFLPGAQLQLLQPALLLLRRRRRVQRQMHPLLHQQRLELQRLAPQLQLLQLLHLVHPAAWLLLQLPLSPVEA